jgi:hypothetical protein
MAYNPNPHLHHQQHRHHSLTPNSCLIGILLVTRSSVGPTLTFHYPPRPRLDSQLSRATRSPVEPNSSSSSSSSGDEDDAEENSHSNGVSDTSKREKRGEEVKKKQEGADTVLGFRQDFLAGMLAPKAQGRFEMSVDDVVFLGAPVHVRPDGSWRKRKKRRRKSFVEGEEEAEAAEAQAEAETEAEAEAEVEAEVRTEAEVRAEAEAAEEEAVGDKESEEPSHVPTPMEEHHPEEREGGNDEQNDGDDERDDDGDTAKDSGTMNMFHVVFVLNPPELEYHFRTSEMFDYVVKRFSRALKYEQARDGYVWRETEKISRLKEQAAQKGSFSSSRA